MQPKVRRDGLGDFQPLATYVELECAETRNVTTGVCEARDEALSERIATDHEYDWYDAGLISNCFQTQRGVSDNHVGRKADKFRGIGPRTRRVSATPSKVDMDVTPLTPAELSQSFRECTDAYWRFWIILTWGHEDADASHPLRLLRARRERPRGRAAEQRDELAPPNTKCHLIPPAGRTTEG